MELHDAALVAAAERIATAIADHENPWQRLEAACVALLEIQLDPDSLTLPMMNDFREVPTEVRKALIQSRDSFENQFRLLVDALHLPDDIDRSIYRNLLLSQLNTAANWYRPGRLTPAQLARQIAILFRHE